MMVKLESTYILNIPPNHGIQVIYDKITTINLETLTEKFLAFFGLSTYWWILILAVLKIVNDITDIRLLSSYDVEPLPLTLPY